jgi:hypothetical protein
VLNRDPLDHIESEIRGRIRTHRVEPRCTGGRNTEDVSRGEKTVANPDRASRLGARRRASASATP